jgi:hypothetical protein
MHKIKVISFSFKLFFGEGHRLKQNASVEDDGGLSWYSSVGNHTGSGYGVD